MRTTRRIAGLVAAFTIVAALATLLSASSATAAPGTWQLRTYYGQCMQTAHYRVNNAPVWPAACNDWSNQQRWTWGMVEGGAQGRLYNWWSDSTLNCGTSYCFMNYPEAWGAEWRYVFQGRRPDPNGVWMNWYSWVSAYNPYYCLLAVNDYGLQSSVRVAQCDGYDRKQWFGLYLPEG